MTTGAVISSASFQLEDHVGRANLVLEIALFDGGYFSAWLDKDEAWGLISRSHVEQVSQLAGKPCVIDTEGNVSKFIGLFYYK